MESRKTTIDSNVSGANSVTSFMNK